MSNYYCLNCGSIVPNGKKFCPVCGDPVIENKKTSIPSLVTTQADTINFVPEKEETTKLSEQTEPTKAVSVEKERTPKAEKKQSFLSKLFFEEVEISDEEASSLSESKGKKSNSHILPIILIVLLAIIIGALGYLYLEKPDILNRGLNKIGLGLPGYTQATETPAPTASASSTTVTATATPTVKVGIGTLTVSIESINIRDLATTTGNAIGKATQGTEYTVLASTTGEGYTWYEIGQDQWIADSNGEWVTFTAN